MRMKQIKKALSLFLCIVLIAAMALLATGCNDNKKSNDIKTSTTDKTRQKDIKENVLGEGEKYFTFTVTDANGKNSSFEINTNKETVGEALLDLDLIVGEQGPYGLFVKTVNGITLDYDTHGKYWAFYADGEYAMSGVDSTKIENGKTYSFKAE